MFAKRIIYSLLFIAGFFSSGKESHAHIGQKNIIQQTVLAGHPARIIIKKPDVIPGIAQIIIRFEDQAEMNKVSVQPVQWYLGQQGSPPPDPALPIQGSPGVYEGELWIMTSNAYSIKVSAQDENNEGSIFVPYSSKSTNTPEMGTFLQIGLFGFLLFLVFMLLAIIRQSVLHSTLKENVITKKRILTANIVTAIAAILVCTSIYGGKRWWDSEERSYTSNRLYKPKMVATKIVPFNESQVVRLKIPTDEMRRRGPLVPDHGKLMHAFLVHKEESTHSSIMAHIHPKKFSKDTFWFLLPSALPDGDYFVFADVSHESGYAQTFIGDLTLSESHNDSSESLGDVEKLWAEKNLLSMDPEDSWLVRSFSGEKTIEMEDGIKISWTGESIEDTSNQLQFSIQDSSGDPIIPERYLGMSAHAAVVGNSGSLYTHLHPTGNISMAAMQLFEFRDSGKLPRSIGKDEPICELPSVEENLEAWARLDASQKPGQIIFPYLAPEDASYRVWIQFKYKGKVRSAFFNLDLKS